MLTKLTETQVKVLKALKNTDRLGKHLTRKQLRQRTGINKGWSKLLGAATRGGGVQGGGLEAKGLIRGVRVEDSRFLEYYITPKGRKELEKAS